MSAPANARSGRSALAITTPSLALALLSAAGAALPVARAQEAAVTATAGTPDALPTPQTPPARPAPAEQPEDPTIEFTLDGAPLKQVLEYFERQTGLSIIYEADVPQATMTFKSPLRYTLSEALNIVNLNLNRHNVHLRRSDGFLYLASIGESVRKANAVFAGRIPQDVPDADIVTLTIPLQNTRAPVVAEQLKAMVASYGGVIPIEAQNVVVLIETAAQARRLHQVVEAIDSLKPVDSDYQVFQLRHAQPEGVVEALKGLIGEKVVQTFIDKDGRKTTVEDTTVPGVNLQADPRLRAIIAVGPASRLQTVSQLVTILDQPPSAGSGLDELRTFHLASAKPEDAARQVEKLFQALKPEDKPAIVPLSAVGKLTVVGTSEQMVKVSALLEALDPGAASTAAGAPDAPAEPRQAEVVRVVTLRHMSADAAERVLQSVLSPAQARSIRFAPIAGTSRLALAGSEASLTNALDLLAGMDMPTHADVQLRRVRVDRGEIDKVLARAGELFELAGGSELGEVLAMPDAQPGERAITLVGPRAAVEAFERALAQAQDAVRPTTIARTYEPASMKPSALAEALRRLTPPLLQGDQPVATPGAEPTFEPLDELGTLIVRAEPWQFAVVDALVDRLEQRSSQDARLAIIDVRSGSAEALVARAKQFFELEATDGKLKPVDVRIDAPTGKLVVQGQAESIDAFTRALERAQSLVPPQRSTRLFDVQRARARDIVEPLRGLIAAADPIDASRAIEPPALSVVEATNTLVATGEAAQLELVRELLGRLDRVEQTDLPPMRLLQLRTAEAGPIARMLSEQYERRPQQERLERPVDVRADEATNTLIVSAHAELFDEVRGFVEELNRASAGEADRQTFTIQLKSARADDVARALERLYPEPPIPLDARGRPMPWARKGRDVTVSSEPGSNLLLIEAPAERIDSLRALASTLDRVELPPQAELRTFRIQTGDVETIARTLKSMASQGIIRSSPRPGQQTVRVVIDHEPRSRTLIVAGDEATFADVEKLLTELGQASVEREVRIIPVAGISASELLERAQDIYRAQTADVPEADEVVGTVDAQTNALQLVSERSSMERFVRIIDELQRQLGPAREVRLLELRTARAADVVQYLREMLASSRAFNLQLGADPVFEPIEATNSVMVAATSGQMLVIEQLVRSVDAQAGGERPPLRILQLRASDATNLARVLQQSYDGRSVAQRASQPVEIRADAATNALLVSAHPQLLPEIERVVSDLNDQGSYDGEGREIRIFPLSKARAEDLARIVDDMFPQPPAPVDRTGRPRPELQEPKDVFVRAEPFTNSLIVEAPSKRLAGFEQLVRELDRERQTSPVDVRTYRPRQGDVAAMARTLQSLAGTSALGNTGSTAISISADVASRSIVVSGPPEIFERVETVLAELGTGPVQAQSLVRTYPLAHARADRLRPMLEQLLATRLREQEARNGPLAGGASALSVLVSVASDAATNTLIVSAPPDLQEIVAEIVRVLDVEQASVGRSTLRVVPLSYGDAAQVATGLSQLASTEELGLTGAVRIVPIVASNAVVLVGVERDVQSLADTLEKLDVRPVDLDEIRAETFVLQHADAEEIARTVERLLADQQQADPRTLQMLLRSARTVRPDLVQGPRVRVEALRRTNSLIVSAPSATLDVARAVIERLDQPAEKRDAVAIGFTPVRAEPGALVEAVLPVAMATIPAGRRELELRVDRASGSIVAIGTREQTAAAVRLLAEHDERAMVAPALDVLIVALEHSEAATVAPLVQDLLADRNRWPADVLAAHRAGLAVPDPSVRAEASGNRLLVSVPTPMASMARELIASLDRSSQGAARTSVQIVRLSSGDATSVAAAVAEAMRSTRTPSEPEPSAVAEPASNSVILSGSSEAVDRALAFVRTLDAKAEPDGVGVRTIRLRHSRSESIAPVLEQLLSKPDILEQLPVWERARFLSRGERGSEPTIRVSAEPRLNAVVVSAPSAVLALAEQVVADLDVADASTRDERSVRVLVINNGDATALAGTIEAMFEAQSAGSDAPPVVRVDPASNALVVRASQAQMAEIGKLVGELDKAALGSSRELTTIPIDRSRADAATIAEMVRSLLQQRSGASVEVIRLEDLLGGPAPGQKEPARTPGRPRGEARPVDESTGLLRGVMMAAVSLALDPSLELGAAAPVADRDAVGAAQPASDPDVTIAVDEASNSLVVLGSPNAAARVAALARMLQSQMPAEPVRVRIVELPAEADASSMAQIVDRSVRQLGRFDAGAGAAARAGGFTGPVSVAADPSGAALIVWANDTDFSVIAELLASVSRLGSAEDASVKVYPLVNVRAEAVESAIVDMLSADPRGSQNRRVRDMALTLLDAAGNPIAQAELDPGRVRVVASASGTALVVTAPRSALTLIDALVETLDQSPVRDRLAIRRYALEHARAGDLSSSLQTLFEQQRQGPGAQDLPRARFVADARTNALLVTASQEQHADIARILESADEPTDERAATAIIPLINARPSNAERIVREVYAGRDPGRAERVTISGDDDSGMMVVRAEPHELEQIRAIVAQVDGVARGLPLRTVGLERADAQQTAEALTRFFEERARASGQRGGRSSVAILGDQRSGTLVVAAGDEDFEAVKEMVATLDRSQPAQEFRTEIVRLKHARASDIRPVLDQVHGYLEDRRIWGGWNRTGMGRSIDDENIIINVNERTNSVILLGQGETLAAMLDLIARLDVVGDAPTSRLARMVVLEGVDLEAMRDVVESAFSVTDERAWWREPRKSVTASVVQGRAALLLIGERAAVEEAVAMVGELAKETAPQVGYQTIVLRHAPADRAAESLRRFFRERATMLGTSASAVTVVGSREGNVLIVSADEHGMALVRDLLAHIDQPDLGKDRRVEIYTIRNSSASEMAETVRGVFPRSQRADEQVIVLPQPSRNLLIVSAPTERQGEISALISSLDTLKPDEGARFVTVALKNVQAEQAANAIRQSLGESSGVRITPVASNNTLSIAGSAEMVEQILTQIATLDVEFTPKPREFRKMVLQHERATEVVAILRSLVRGASRPAGAPMPEVDYSTTDNAVTFTASPSEVAWIESLVRGLDVPRQAERRTDWLRLRYADAEQAAKVLEVFYGRFAFEARSAGDRDVTIRADGITNSLIVSAGPEQWENIRSLIARIDTEEYDTERQLGVIALEHADASAVARALNEGLSAPLRARIEQERARSQQGSRDRQGDQSRPEDRELSMQPITIADDDVPTVSAEERTNSLVVFAAPRQLARIEAIVEQLDAPVSAERGEARLIAVDSGKPSAIAASIREVFVDPLPAGTRPVVFGDDDAGVIIVRSDEQSFTRIRALAKSLGESASDRLGVRSFELRTIPAARVQAAVRNLLAPIAQRNEEPVVVELDRAGNALVVSGSPRVLDEAERLVAELDRGRGPGRDPEGGQPKPGPQGAVPGVGVGLGADLAVVELRNHTPAQMRQALESLGLTRAQDPQRPGLVGEPVTVIELASRRAVGVMAGAADLASVVSIVRALDSDDAGLAQSVAIVQLKNTTAEAVVRVVREMLARASEDAQGPVARAMAEQVRRRTLALEPGPAGGGAAPDQQPTLDLVTPVQLIEDGSANRVIVASSEANVSALRSIIASLDVVAVGDAVVVRIIPLTSASPQQLSRVIGGLFERGQQLARRPGGAENAVSSTITGQALAGEIAIEVDARTNALIVAGREEAVQLVEVLVQRLDSEQSGGWVEPRVIALQHASASALARTLESALVEPTRGAAEAMGVREQFARLRMSVGAGAPHQPGAAPAPVFDPHGGGSDLFAPVSGLFISSDPALNALIVVSTPANLDIVQRLVSQLDVPSASMAGAVRFFPLQRATADRVGDTVARVFRERAQSADLRPEDRVIVQADARTNTLVVWTSASSMAVVESLISRLDAQEDRLSVGVHVLAVPDFDVQQLAGKIDLVMRARIDAQTLSGSRATSDDVFAIQAEPNSGVLILTCSESNRRAVEDLITTIRSGVNVLPEGVPAGAAALATPELIPVRSGFVRDIADKIQTLYVEPENRTRGPDSVAVLADERLSALIVRGTAADAQRVREIVAELDVPRQTTLRVLERIELRYSNAVEVSEYVRRLLVGAGGAGRQPRSAETLRLVVRDRQSGVEKLIEADIDDAVRRQVDITPEERSNSVTVIAPEPIMGFIRAIIEDQESSDNADRSVKHFVLKNASARAMARVLRDLFDLREVGSELILVPSPRNAVGPDGSDLPPVDTRLQPVADPRQQLSITVDERTNSLLVSGTREYLQQVEEVISKLESIDVAQRYRLVYQLRNAQAREVEAALRDYFGSEQRAATGITTPDAAGSLESRLEYEVTIVGDPKSNTVLVAASPRQIEVVEQIIRELDTAPPQVKIEVLMAEVTLDDGQSFGVDLTLRNIGGDNFSYRQTPGGLGLTATVGGANLSLASSDIDLMVRALEGRGRLRVLSRPQLTVANNEVGEFKVVENVAQITGFQTLQDGRTRAEIQREEVGVKLLVTPTINPDGFVRMDIQPEISALTDSRTQISEEFVSDNFTERALKTVVTVRNGQTAVIGGIIQTSEEQRRTKVPGVGDIPVVGWVFRTNKVENVRTELLMLLTPRVIPSDQQGSVRVFNDLTGEEINRMSDPLRVREQIPGFGPGTQNLFDRSLRGEPAPSSGVDGDGESTSEAWFPRQPIGSPPVRRIDPLDARELAGPAQRLPSSGAPSAPVPTSPGRVFLPDGAATAGNAPTTPSLTDGAAGQRSTPALVPAEDPQTATEDQD